ncbi:MAG TPA: YggS family pyridoxal phosphate-dependent enzyme, partial [Rhodobacteraceae bacterium]|nr:YggS family pyridoxal phosphate-dependent enzyme [Paracoccaceae bacterium]
MPLADILDRIAREEARVGRAPGSTRLVAVSKVQPVERVVAVLEQGQRLFGENKVQ